MTEHQAPQSKLIKLTMKYDDGTVQVLEGQDAQDWLEWVNGCCVMSQIHGGGGKSFNWKVHNVLTPDPALEWKDDDEA